MKPKKLKTSPKKLKNLPNLQFQQRQTWQGETYHEIHDSFLHTQSGIALTRITTVWNDHSRQWIHWTCPELGGGNASISYWLSLAKKQCRPNK